jgi:hypothetical protein
MDQQNGFSLLHPAGAAPVYRSLPDHVMHDLGLEAFCKAIAGDVKE